ncbi:glycosyltransferase family 2 protein [Pantanalinema rosaneae CENA516]|uniref:glycosyltransferase family 2 protein n=1 Tax=Pantanalinema rosaneae TaxID=1620701 RepID=UPI003D6EBAE5
MAIVDILLPTCERLSSLILTLAGVVSQTVTDRHVILADQSLEPVINSPVIQTLLRLIESRGGSYTYHHRLPSQGIAEQREFLLQQACADVVLYLDDDVFMEPWVVERLLATLQAEQCGFVGAFPTGLSYRDDIRPEQQQVEFWQGAVTPEIVQPKSPAWERFHLHRAANLYHVSQTLPPGEFRRYKVAWVACCILYDRAKLLQVGGFSFWDRLPRYHSGEEVLVQNLLMRRWGGCAIVPSGTYHAEVASTVLNPQGTVDGHALELLPEMVARYVPETLEV